MLHLNFSVYNPFYSKERFPWKSLYNFNRQANKNCIFEIKINFSAYYIFSICLDGQMKGRNFAGPHIKINILGLELSVSARDTRMWNCKTNNWEK